ncbi:MAG: alkaline phosphatase [Promethearchaeota archaeon]|nr:MAG: alkaline phosphatase [Candidatus Lokiarchaeota archaeon]
MGSRNLNKFAILISLFIVSTILPSFSTSISNDITPPTGIILFIGDGTGFEHIELARLVEYGPVGGSAILELPYQGSVSTTNIDGFTTDSAASATAIATGVKTTNGRIAMNFDASMDLTTILEIAQDNGYATGVVATCHLTHATPAAFMAHDPARGNYQEIAEDISNASVDVLLGGGSSTSYLGNYISGMESEGYSYITNKTELNSTTTGSILGLFTSVSLTPMYLKNETSAEPSLLEMTQKAIELLNSTMKPFFLMIEASQIDWGSHDNDAVYTALEAIEFEKSVRYAKGLAEQDANLQLLVTADHETGGLDVDEYDFLTELPLDTDDFETRKNKRIARVGEVSVSWLHGGHTMREVILAGMGPNTQKILDATHHIDTFSIMREVIDGKTGPVQINAYEGHVNWFVVGFISILGVAAILTAVLTWIKTKRK